MSLKLSQPCEDIVTNFRNCLESLSVEEQYQILQPIIASSNGYLKWRFKSWLSKEPTPDLLTLLPPEIQLMILKMVDGSSLLNACQVSKAWNSILKDHSHLWKEKSIELGVNVRLKPLDLSWKSAFSMSRQQLHRIETGMAFKEKFVNLQNCKKSVKAVDYHDGYLCAVSDEDCINIWQLELNIPVLSFLVIPAVSCIKFRPKSTLVCGHFTGILTSWDLTDMSDSNFQQFTARSAYNNDDIDFSEFSLLKAKFKMHSGPVFSCDFSEDLQLLVSGSADETVKFWCLNTGNLLFTLASHKHWVLRAILVPHSRRNCMHSLITMTRDSVDKYDWCYDGESEKSNDIQFDQDAISRRRGDYNLIKHFIKVKLNQNNDNFITPGLQMSANYIGLVKQDLQEKHAHLLILDSSTFQPFKEISLNLKVRKLLALGDRYALLLTIGRVLYTSLLVVVDIITGQKVGSHMIPHSKMTTPDGAQIIVGDTEWLDGLTGWDKFQDTMMNVGCQTHSDLPGEELESSPSKMSLCKLGLSYDHRQMSLLHCSTSGESKKHMRNSNRCTESRNLVLAAGIRVDVGRVFTLWWKKKEDDDKRKVD